MTERTEAQRLAEFLKDRNRLDLTCDEATVELLRLDAENAALRDAADNALNTLIGCCVSAGGVDDRKTILETQAMLRAVLSGTAPARKPLSEAGVKRGWADHSLHPHVDERFTCGVRFAERKHGITGDAV